MTVTLEEAQKHLAELIAKQIPGEEICITQDDGIIARVIKEHHAPIKPRVSGSAKGMLTILAEDDEHLKDFADYM